MIHCATVWLTIIKVTSYSCNIRFLVLFHGVVNLLISFKRVYLTVKRFVFFNELRVVRVENVRNFVIITPLEVSLTLLIGRLWLIYWAVSNFARASLTDLRKIIATGQRRINFIFGINQLYILVIHCLFM